MRSTRALQSETTKRTVIASATSAGSSTVISRNLARQALSIYNDSTAVLSIYLMDLDTYNEGSPMPTYELPAAGLWEDPGNYVGDIVLVWASANGQANVTEWL